MTTRNRAVLQKKLAGETRRILKIVGRRRFSANALIDVFLLGEQEIKALKKKFLPNAKGPANVLAFPEPKNWPNPKWKKRKIGEIYLNEDLTQGDFGALRLLLVHGILHLLGYSHKRKNDRIKMETLESKLVNQCLTYELHHRS